MVEDENRVHLVVIDQLKENEALLWCDCKCDFYCKHIYAVFKAIRNKKFNNFYKVKYTGGNESLLEKVTVGNFQLCFGIEDDKCISLYTIIDENGNYLKPFELFQIGKIKYTQYDI